MPWNVIGNYKSNGEPRDRGTLKEGNGTVIYYAEDGTVDMVVRYEEGIEVAE